MQTLRPAGAADFGKLTLLGAIWGSAFICVEIALASFSPFVLATWRILIGTAILLPIVTLRREPWPRDSHTLALILLAGLFYNAIPFSLISWGQQYISSGMAALLMSCGPFIALALSHFLTSDDRFSLVKLISVTLGFMGVVVLIGAEALGGQSSSVLGQLAMVAAVSCYILSGLVIRRIHNVGPVMVSTSILTSSCIYMLPLSLWLGDLYPAQVDQKALLALIFLGVVPTGLAYIIRVQLLREVGTNFLALVSYLIPLFGLLWSWLFLNQIPGSSIWIALSLILTGLLVSQLGARKFNLSRP